MSLEEIYLTCVCGALISNENLTDHMDGCLKKDLFQRAQTLRITKTDRNSRGTKHRYGIAECVRCGNDIYKDDGTLVRFNPSQTKSVFASCISCIKSKRKSDCSKCDLPEAFHDPKEEFESEVHLLGRNAFDKAANKKFREIELDTGRFLEEERVDSNCDHTDGHGISKTSMKRPPCKTFHVALIPNYEGVDDKLEGQGSFTLLIQILENRPPTTVASTQTDYPLSKDVGTQVKIMGVYPEGIAELLHQAEYDVPEYNPAAEAAFRSHVRSLVPCLYCQRTFSPDRILKHESCCIERPRKREYITPEKGELK